MGDPAQETEQATAGTHIPLPLDLLAALKAYAALRAGQKLFPYTTAGAWKALKMACKDAGIRRSLHPHLFGHGVCPPGGQRPILG